MKEADLKQNFAFQMAYQILIYAVPLVVSPYLTRTLGGKSLGIYTYVNSIAYYFLLFINLGINKHGQRIIAATRDDETELRKNFWSLFAVHTVASAFGILAYIIFVSAFCSENRSIYIIQTAYVASAFADITWLFYGLENFRSVAIKNACIKTLECILIFMLVKKAGDLKVYTVIVSASALLGQMIMIPQGIKICKPIKITFNDAKRHIKPMVVLFISVIATTLYTVFDKTLLGALSNTIENVAYYEYANKIISIPKVIISVVGTVIFPRACKCAANHDMVGQKNVMRLSCITACILGSASTFGLAAVSKKLAIVYYGKEFLVCGQVMLLMTPLILIVSLGDIFRSGYLIPCHKDNTYVVSNIISAIINILISAMMIPHIGIYGAILGTFIAETIGFILQAYACKNIFKFKDIFDTLFPFLFVGLIMYLIVAYIDRNTEYTLLWLSIEVIIGIIVYGMGTVLIFAVLGEKYIKSVEIKKILEKYKKMLMHKVG